MEKLRRVHGKNIEKWGATHPETIVLSGDLTASCEIDGFRDKFPTQFLSMGLAEQNMVSFAAGLAREGFVPHVHTFSVFMYRRALDQLEMSIAYPNLSVKFFGFLPGITTPGGASHQAINDLAVFRSLPNFTILETGDATDVETCIEVANSVNGPVYVRMMRGELPRLFPKNDGFVLNKARLLSEGDDIAILSTGICTQEAMPVIKKLRESGVSVQHLHITTLKPFTDKLVMDTIKKVKFGIVSFENHSKIGGLGTCLAELIADLGIGKTLRKIGINDTYLQGASPNYLKKRYRIDATTLLLTVEDLLNSKLGITLDEDLTPTEDIYFDDRQQEAL
tara:strand:- start:920 stop:1927 length:1008 start_codon:yes stop_codon:yes gene_type:complete